MKRVVAILATIVLATLGGVLPVATAPAGAAPTAPAIALSVVSVSPQVPRPAYGVHRLRIELAVRNLTTQPLDNVTIDGLRAETARIRSADSLTQTIANPPTSGWPVPSTHPISLSLGAAGSADATATAEFVTTVGLPTTAGFCLCDQHAVVPLVLQAYGDLGSGTQLLGSTQVFIPSFQTRPPRVSVSWVWPLIDRPHRLALTNDFLDDDLAASVTDGRLERCLQVLEQVAPHIPVTVVIDPELLDELQIMATTHYRYFDSSGTLVPGTGSSAAQEWLARLRAVLQNNPGVSVALTPLADPEVQSLSRSGLGWQTSLDSATQRRVTAALGGASVATDFAWPPSGVIGHAALSSLYGAGYRSLLLSSQSIRRRTGPAGLPITLARLSNGGDPVTAAITSSELETEAAAAVTLENNGTNLSELLARIAVRLAQRPRIAGQTVVLTPPRYVDPTVSSAVTAMLTSSRTMITQPANLLSVLAGAESDPLPSAASHAASPGPRPLADQLAALQPDAQPVGLPPANLRIAHSASALLASLRSLFGHGAAAQQRLADLATGVERIESAAWRPGVTVGGRPVGAALARELRSQVQALVNGVHIITPRSRSYTLASTNSPLLITVENDLDYPAYVQVSVRPVNGVPGLEAGPVHPQVVQPHSKTTLHVPTQVQRSGRIQVRAVLLTPDGQQLGAPVPLTVNSTALGTIGVVITIVAGAVLLLALLVRLVRRLMARRRPPSAPPWLDEPDGPMPDKPNLHALNPKGRGRAARSRRPAGSGSR